MCPPAKKAFPYIGKAARTSWRKGCQIQIKQSLSQTFGLPAPFTQGSLCMGMNNSETCRGWRPRQPELTGRPGGRPLQIPYLIFTQREGGSLAVDEAGKDKYNNDFN